MDWFEIKNWLELSTGLNRDSLHIYAGVGVQLFVALMTRRSLASPLPWFFVLIVAVTNEYYDYSNLPETVIGGAVFWDEAIRDIWNTLLLPSIFLIIARFWPAWLISRTKADQNSEKPEEINPTI